MRIAALIPLLVRLVACGGPAVMVAFPTGICLCSEHHACSESDCEGDCGGSEGVPADSDSDAPHEPGCPKVRKLDRGPVTAELPETSAQRGLDRPLCAIPEMPVSVDPIDPQSVPPPRPPSRIVFCHWTI